MDDGTRMVSRRNLLKAAAAGTGAMLVPSVLDRAAMAADSPAILAGLSYNPSKVQNFVAAGTWTSLTPARVTFVAPASGQILLGMAASVHVSPNGAQGYWRVANVAGGVAGSEQLVTVTLAPLRISSRVLVSGLTPGAAQDWTMQQRTLTVGSTINTSAGHAGTEDPGVGPLTIMVIAA